MGKEFDAKEALITTAAVAVVLSIFQAIQFPFNFKLGYAKAKIAVYLPLVCIPLFIFVGMNALEGSSFLLALSRLPAWVVANSFASLLIGFIIWLVIVIVSYRFSVTYYKRRDL